MSVRQLFVALSGLERGPEILTGIDQVEFDVDSVLSAIDALVPGSPDPAMFVNLGQQAAEMISRLRHAGLAGLMAGAIATIDATHSLAKAKLQAVCGSSAGFVASLVLATLDLLSDPLKREAWLFMLVHASHNTILSNIAPDTTLAQEALKRSPLMSGRMAAGEALELMRKVLQRNQSGELVTSSDLAHSLSARVPFVVPARFASEQELAEAIAEYRNVLAFLQRRQELTGQVDISGIEMQQSPASVPLQFFADICLELESDPRAAAEIERLAFAVEAFSKLPLPRDQLRRLALDTVHDALEITRNRHQKDLRGIAPSECSN